MAEDEKKVSALDFNISPYYDDFDEGKKFVKTLFKPSTSVQTRELTQLQSVLQNQVSRLADGFFKDGTMVVPGQLAYDTDYSYVKILPSYNGQDINPQDFVGRTIRGKTTGLSAVVLHGEQKTEKEYDTLFIKYLDGGTKVEDEYSTEYKGNEGSEVAFVKNEIIVADISEGEIPIVGRTIDSIDETIEATGYGSAAYIEEGIYYVRGFMVQVDKQFIVLDKYSKTPSYRVGLEVIEDIVTAEDDESLYDNARGSLNFNAAGADRHRIRLILTKRALDSVDDENFIELLRLDDGNPVMHVRTTDMDIIEDTLARRTYDESGDYTVRAFKIDVREFVEEDENRGIYQYSDFAYDTQMEAMDDAKARFNLVDAEGNGTIHTPTLTDLIEYPDQELDVEKYYPGDTHDEFVARCKDLLAIGMESGKAYVKGYEIEKVGTEYLDFWKSRTHNTETDNYVRASMGNYILSSDQYSFPAHWDTIDLYNANAEGLNRPSAYTDAVKIGTAKVKGIEIYSDVTPQSELMYSYDDYNSTTKRPTVWKIYLFDIDLDPQYTMDSARGWQVSEEMGANTMSYGNILTQYMVLNPDQNLYANGKGDIANAFDKVNRGQTYYYNSSRQEVLVKHTNTMPLFSNGETVTETAQDIQTNAVIARKNQTIDSSNTFLLYPLPYTDIKTIKNTLELSDTQYEIRRTIEVTLDANGIATEPAKTGEKFVSFDDDDYNLTFMSGTYAGKCYSLSSSNIITQGEGGTTGDNLEIDLGPAYAHQVVRVTVTTEKISNGAKEKVKSLEKKTIAPYSGYDNYGIAVRSPIPKSVKDLDAYYIATWPNTMEESEKKIDWSEITLEDADVLDIIVYDTCNIDNGSDISADFGYQVDDDGNRKSAHQLSYDDAEYAYNEFQKFIADNNYKTTTGNAPVQIEDVTERFDFDNGQRPSMLELAKLKLKPGALRPTGRIIVAYRYFNHGSGDYASVDSYTLNGDGIDKEDIPYFESVSLSDVLDFRPVTTYNYNTSDGLNSREERIYQNFDTKSQGFTNAIKPNSDILCSYQYYLNRIDKVYLTKEGDFKIKYGTPAIDPDIPTDPDDGMVLYTINTPAYTNTASEIECDMQDNRRYTMRDIGKLEKRIEKMEYFTSLSMLEKETEGMSITDNNGLERFKNGFVVDSFTGHNVGNVNNLDYKCSIDSEQGELRPEFDELNVPIEFNDTESKNVIQMGDLIMLPYTHEVFAQQPYASRSINVNPFAIFTFNGDLTLYPSTDNWRDVKRAPDLVINKEGNYDTIAAMAKKTGALGTVWNNWKTDWSGVTSTSTSKKDVRFTSRNSRDYGIAPHPWWPHPWGRQGRGVQTTTKITTKKKQSRTGIRTKLVPEVTRENIGDKVINTTMIPYMRSREVMFVATGMKPATRVYPFFEDKPVSDWCRPAAQIKFKYLTNNIKIKKGQRIKSIDGKLSAIVRSVSANEDGTNVTAFVSVSKYLLKKYGREFSEGDYLKVGKSSQRVAEVISFTQVGPKGTALMTDSTGTIVGLFRLPNTSKLRFRCGDRTFKLSDKDDPKRKDTDTKAEAQYSATGIMETKQSTIISTKNAKLVQEQITDNRTITTTTKKTETQLKGWYDPLAETFMITEKGGLFLSKIDIFFAKKDKNIPVSVQIRETVNGYPGKRILPGGEVSLNPEDVNVPSDPNNDASVPTTFEFESPIYLQELTEYCFVIMSNCQGYECFLSHLGEKDLGTNRTISAQPYAGVFFKSQNASTWTADQYKDLKFTLYRAKFDNSQPSTVVLQNGHEDDLGNNLDIDFLGAKSFFSREGSKTVRVHHRDHGMFVDDYVQFTHIDEAIYNGIPSSELLVEDGLKITSIELDSYTIEVDTAATSEGYFGEGEIRATSNFSADLLVPMVQEMTLPGTTTDWAYRSTTGQSINSNFMPYVKDPVYQSFIMNENIFFDVPKVIASEINESKRMSGVDQQTGSQELGKRSLVYICNMTSPSDNLTPILDLSRASTTVISNRVNNPSEGATLGDTRYIEEFVNEEKSYGGSISSKYMTREVELADTAIGLKVMFNVHRPVGAEVDVYYKTKRPEEKGNFDDLHWTAAKDPANYDPAATAPEQYDEYQYIINDLDEFVSFSVKIVMRTSNSAKVPKIKDLRVIALGT